MTTYVYICPNCDRPHSLEEFDESRFCRHCGKFLTSRDRRILEQDLIKKENISTPTDIEKSIERTYRLIQRSIPLNTQIDSLEVVDQVEEYRQFWKPKRINVVLLAESHVYTDEEDYEIECDSSILHRIIPNYPLRFVRFVYCLGYGENELLVREINSNKRGTPDFWKIFSYCVGEDETKVLKMGTWEKTPENLEERLRNKVNVLQKMREKGVWLLDASIVGLSKMKRNKTKKKTIKICWDNHIAKVIRESKPNYIVVIGKRVASVLSLELQKLKIPFEILPQPRGQSVEYYERYQRICVEYC